MADCSPFPHLPLFLGPSSGKPSLLPPSAASFWGAVPHHCILAQHRSQSSGTLVPAVPPGCRTPESSLFATELAWPGGKQVGKALLLSRREGKPRAILEISGLPTPHGLTGFSFLCNNSCASQRVWSYQPQASEMDLSPSEPSPGFLETSSLGTPGRCVLALPGPA